jgi:cell division protein ZapA (FtsZ GTPase activity inhibitor)
MSERLKTKIRIRNDELTVTSPCPAEQLHAAAAYVDEIMGSLARSATGMPPGRLATLAALNIASELVEARRQLESLQNALAARSRQMLELLEARTGPGHARSAEARAAALAARAASSP